MRYDGYVITDQKTTNSVNTIIMLLCSCRKMCTFAAKIAQNRFNEHEFRIYIAPFPAYLIVYFMDKNHYIQAMLQTGLYPTEQTVDRILFQIGAVRSRYFLAYR